jgi:hypothetical protein
LTDLPTDENTAITSCTKYYSEDDILNAKDNNYILEEEFSLYADVAKLLENKDFITNYSVTCYVTISDCTDGTHSTGAVSADDTGNSGSTEDDGDVTQAKKSGITDFFIFTVAKIKTDMD